MVKYGKLVTYLIGFIFTAHVPKRMILRCCLLKNTFLYSTIQSHSTGVWATCPRLSRSRATAGTWKCHVFRLGSEFDALHFSKPSPHLCPHFRRGLAELTSAPDSLTHAWWHRVIDDWRRGCSCCCCWIWRRRQSAEYEAVKATRRPPTAGVAFRYVTYSIMSFCRSLLVALQSALLISTTYKLLQISSPQYLRDTITIQPLRSTRSSDLDSGHSPPSAIHFCGYWPFFSAFCTSVVEQTSSFPSGPLSVWFISQLPSACPQAPTLNLLSICLMVCSILGWRPISFPSLFLLSSPSHTDWLIGKWIGMFLVVFGVVNLVIPRLS